LNNKVKFTKIFKELSSLENKNQVYNQYYQGAICYFANGLTININFKERNR
jgi:hypothetical protein